MAGKIDVDQFAQSTLRLQPVPGGQFGGRFGHASNDVAEDGRAQGAVDAQFGELLGKTELRQGVQGEMLDADRARLGLLQGVNIDLLKVGGGSLGRYGADSGRCQPRWE